jgi:DNA-binding NtrC family response regulator/tetratricopeptide (TPR) repeat protein
VVEHDGRPALVPDPRTGTRWSDPGAGDDGGAADASREVARLARMTAQPWADRDTSQRPGRAAAADGVDATGRETIARLVEVFETGEPARPRAVEVALPADAQRAVFLSQLAREARLHGYVPVNTALLADRSFAASDREELRDALADRHVLLIHDPRGGGGTSLALFLVALGLSNSRPHVVALVVDSPRPGLHVRERPTPYAPDRGEAGRGSAALLRLASATGRDAVAVRAQANLGAASRLAAAGRHAAAERLLRESLGALGRRDDPLGAGWAAAVLGCLLLVRGRALQAAACFEQAREHFDRARAAPAAGHTAVHLALAWTDLGRLEQAEAAARAVVLAAQETGDAWMRGRAALALARCLLWQERFGEGLQVLDGVGAAAAALVSKVAEVPPPFETGAMPGGPPLPGAIDHEVARACLRARLGLALGDLGLAGRSAACARMRSASCGDAASQAAAATAQLAVYGAIGDLEGAERMRLCGLGAARRARAPLRALRLRIAWVDALARSGTAREAATAAAQLARLDRQALPWVVRRSLERATRVAAPPAVPPGSSGRVALRLAPVHPAAAPSLEWLLDDIVEVLGLCQGPEDEESMLRAVTGRLRRRHRFAALACFVVSEGALVAVASDGSSPAPEGAARRAVEVGRALAPEAFAERNEAAVPVRYAGAVIGALAGRWAADEAPDWSRTGAVLSAAAAAVAPALRAVADRKATASAVRGGGRDEIVGVSEAAAMLRREVERAAAVPFSVLVEGESGTGKELVARALHQRGPRRHRRLCAVNCAALSDELFEAELFGHSRGAFTGAVAERKGLFEEADGGTLVLDEVGELTPRAQAKLLRAIQEGEIRRVGENFARAVDARVVASTNRPLRTVADEGRFRRDLLYRLDVVRIVVPPLRDRVDDIPVLASHFWQIAIGRLGSRATLSPAAVTALARYDWPGNIRELQNVIAALAVGAGPRGSVGAGSLPAAIAGAAAHSTSTLEQARTVFEARYVRAALARSGGRRGETARELGVTRQGLSKLLARLSIEG